MPKGVEHEKHQVSPENAALILDRIRTRGGIAIWNCHDLSDPGKTWTCPVNDNQGNPKTKPHWAAGEIIRTITNPDEVEVVSPKIVRKFHIGLRMGAQGFKIKLTDASSRRVRNAVAKAQEKYGEAWHEFDYEARDALILVPDEKVLLLDFLIKGKGSKVQ